MPFQMKIYMKNGIIIKSPYIAPNNPTHNYNNPKISKEINKTGVSLMKNIPEIVSFQCEFIIDKY